MERKPTGILPR